MNKLELVRRVRKSRAEIESLIAALPEERLNEKPGTPAGWTVKDLLAHLAYWERPTLDVHSGRSKSTSWGNVGAVNAELLERSRRRTVSDVLQEFQQSGKNILQQIEALSDEQLQQESPWKDGKTLEDHVSDDTWVHYEHHLKTLSVWVSRKAP